MKLLVHYIYTVITNAKQMLLKEQGLVVNCSCLNKSQFLLKSTEFPRLSNANEMEFKAQFLMERMVILRGVEHMCLPVRHETFIVGEIKEL